MSKIFTEWLDKQQDYGLCEPPMTLQEFEDFIEEYLLPDNYICTSIASTVSQCRTAILFDILMDYSKKFRKEWRRYLERNKKMY